VFEIGVDAQQCRLAANGGGGDERIAAADG
jgi:hypothetical protein